MKTSTVREHFEAIKDASGGHMDKRSMVTVVKALIGRPLEAVMPVANTAALVLATSRCISESTARVSHSGQTRMWSQACSNAYRRCLVLDTPKGRYAVLLHLENEPCSWTDQHMAELHRSGVLNTLPEPADTKPGRPEEIVVCRVWPEGEDIGYGQPSLESVMEEDAKPDQEGQHVSLCFSRSRSTEGCLLDESLSTLDEGKGGEWLDGRDQLRADGLEAWPVFFKSFLECCVTVGVFQEYADSMQDMSRCIWHRPDGEWRDISNACEDFANAVNVESALCLGSRALDAVQALQSMAMSEEAETMYEHANFVKHMLEEKGHRGRDMAYTCNDLDNSTWLDENGSIVFKDQNCLVKATCDASALVIESLDPVLPPLNFAFQDGIMKMCGLPDLGVDAARNWDNLAGNMEAVMECLEEDYSNRPSPTP